MVKLINFDMITLQVVIWLAGDCMSVSASDIVLYCKFGHFTRYKFLLILQETSCLVKV